MKHGFKSVDEIKNTLAKYGYVAETKLATVVYLSLILERPLFLEGEAGVGKTDLAKVLAEILGRPLVRLQCYEGLDRQTALYDWNYPRQLLHIRLAETAINKSLTPEVLANHRNNFEKEQTWKETVEQELYSEQFLLRRPLLSAISPLDGIAPVLLVDEVDRSDEEFEAFLLELMAEFQVTIPELGTIRAKERPLVVLTSNRTREVHDALKRRCLYHWIDYPSFSKEMEIVRNKLPQVEGKLAAQICAFVARLRQEPLFKLPGVAETIHWAQALEALGAKRLSPEWVESTIGCLLKYKDDFDFLAQNQSQGHTSITRLLAEIGVDKE